MWHWAQSIRMPRNARVTRPASLSGFTLFFSGETVCNCELAKASDTTRFAAFHRAMLERGVYLPPSQLESAFVSLAHTPDDVAQVVAAAGESLESLERSRR